MNLILSPEDIQSVDRNRVGGKGYALSLLVKNGFRIPRTVCITSDAYHEFVLRTGLRERILLELFCSNFIEKISRRCAGKKSGIAPPAFAICS
jgi:phosphoenolpyruvate synthase/pyruvate phosphate dikinase